MSIRNLEDGVKKRVEKAIKGIQLKNEEGEYVDPIIVTGALPKEAIRGNPFILIQTTKIEDLEMETLVRISLLYGTIGMDIEEERSKDKNIRRNSYMRGHWDTLGIVEKIRMNFLGDTNFEFGLLDRRMHHDLLGNIGFKSYMGESQLTFRVNSITYEDSYV